MPGYLRIAVQHMNLRWLALFQYRIEVPPEEIPRLLDPAVRERVVRELKDAGYTFVALDLQGYRTGSFNETESYPAAPAHHVQRPVASCRR